MSDLTFLAAEGLTTNKIEVDPGFWVPGKILQRVLSRTSESGRKAEGAATNG